MKLHEILGGLRQGKYAVLVHEPDPARRTPDQFEANFAGFVDNPDQGMAFCYRLQQEEISRGEAPKTYVVSNILEQYFCVPNVTEEEVALVKRKVEGDMDT